MAIQRAAGFLERHLSDIHSMTKKSAIIYNFKSFLNCPFFIVALDTFEVCILTYALTLSKSASSGQAYNAMMGRAREDGSMIYWGTNITTNR